MRGVIQLIFLVMLPLFASPLWGLVVTQQHASYLYDGNQVAKNTQDHDYDVIQKLLGDGV